MSSLFDHLPLFGARPTEPSRADSGLPPVLGGPRVDEPWPLEAPPEPAEPDYESPSAEEEAELLALRGNEATGASGPTASGGAGWTPAGADGHSGLGDPESLISGLNEQQREAAIHTGSPLLIVAGAGSGKTRVLTQRIAYLLATRQALPHEILAITFTNKAAAEMRERVAQVVGEAARHMWVSTFHSSCVRILRREAKTLGMSSSFSVYDSQDSLRLLTLVMRELDLDPKRFPPKGFANRISSLKNELIDAEDFARTVDAKNPYEVKVSEAYTRYTARLRQANAMDFDDLIAQTVYLFRAFPAVTDNYRRRFRHILVDEYQDTNHAQYALIRELAGPDPRASLTVVGDSDQSIYAFRGATIRNILEFEEDYPTARTVLLEQNYRSTQRILTAANAVISANRGRREKKLWTAAGDGDLITLYVAEDERAEARFVCQTIDQEIDAGRFSASDIAIFYRTNAQSRALEDQLIRVGLPYRVVGGTRFYERKEIKDAVAYLRVLANPDDTVNLRRILNVPKRGIGDRAEACLVALSERDQISFNAALRRAEDAPGLAARSATSVRGFVALLDEFAAALESGISLAELVELVLDRTGYIAELRKSVDPQDESRIENLAELVAVAAEFQAQDQEGTLADFLERVSLVADADQIPDGESGDGGVITLMTMHTAKGLEFPLVFVTGMEDGTFPHQRSLADAEQLEEERRLAYVGITRARQKLVLSRAQMRSAWGQPSYFPASRFLDEIPAEALQVERSSAVSGGFAGRGVGAPRYRDADFGAVIGSGRAPSGAGSSTPAFTVGSGGALKRHTAPTAEADLPQLSIGDRVTHDSFGLGTVTGLSGAGRNTQVEVDFGGGSVKRLLLRLAPVTKL
ncbi:DNA helicase PcrA [Micrococcales bacterium 31B]|nr:DNA helicase PcrA [Micrococcales bacterium 31B]